ncbi:short-chain fatty acyl-CoA regulator family protein [Alisedimentitalea sp. MJ-SS2]|uniref:helix-turn-helix domain-containing protein n=1 Tax=Aliisedimentitalea sp. MJ-SS2 TaxID=3049795 RepID=UPI002914A746|nr:short-chain fatty acyl-CoA regulator family protein [Alisedimentitalea sp. MJ-SS2]MDU8928103.1 short-chain fatty acyl-CoA regulator family protein [Alisedimentitalea sp. MJ-SS2]
MEKTFIGSQLRQLRQSHGETQAQMAKRLGISPAYVNLLESNQRSLSVKVLLSITEIYGVEWRDLLSNEDEKRLPELRAAMRDPIFAGNEPDLLELRAALDHSPRFVARFLQIYDSHRNLTDRLGRGLGQTGADDLLAIAPETAIHNFFRDKENHFADLESRAEDLRARIGGASDDLYASLKRHLRLEHEVSARLVSSTDMPHALREFDDSRAEVRLSETLDHPNRVFQLAHVLGLLAARDIVDDLVASAPIPDEDGQARLAVELVNYFAGALVMPYENFFTLAEASRYDISRLKAAFCTSFEQVSHRLTTLQRAGQRGVPFFLLRIDRAGNVTKRFNATPFTLAEQGGSCPVWNIHAAFDSPGTLFPQLVELPDGGRFLTLSRTADRPALVTSGQTRRLAISLGCASVHSDRVKYADRLTTDASESFARIGITCNVCPRVACSHRAHQPLNVQLRIDANRRGATHHES